ncbi:MAG: HEPN domain-containing protein [Defluviitaleaceae bacterium]|nr:HEPN domain-containing protein [Defluviitaleaceae bacterium]
MQNKPDYITIALRDLRSAVVLHKDGLWNNTVISCEQFVEKALKQIVFVNQETDEKLFEKDTKLLKSHKVYQLGKRVEQILGVSYSEEELKRFVKLENYYFNANYPGDDYEAIGEKYATETLEWTKTFAPKIQGQIQKQLEDLQSNKTS